MNAPAFVEPTDDQNARNLRQKQAETVITETRCGARLHSSNVCGF